MRCTECVQVYNPWDQIGLYGQDPGNDLQLSGTYYCAAGHSGQGAPRAAGRRVTDIALCGLCEVK